MNQATVKLAAWTGKIGDQPWGMLAVPLALAVLVYLPSASACACHSVLGAAPQEGKRMSEWPTSMSRKVLAEETHLANARQLTFGGQNAEAYWSLDGSKLVYQTKQPEWPDEQIVVMNADGSGKTLVSTGLGRCTCSYFSPDMKWVYFSSTHSRNEGAQKPLDMSKGYVWMINPEFSLYRTPLQALSNRGPGRGAPRPQVVLDKGGYVAETTISPDGKFMVFTGAFDGDIDIYRSDLDGKDVRRLTQEVGYDGGPFVSWDSKKIVYRRSSQKSPEELAAYQELLKEHMVRPSKMDLWIMDADGQNKRQVTNLGGASFAPFLHPDGKRIIFSSNHHDPRGREFDLFVVNTDGTGLKQVTFSADFDGFPMFTRDGKKLVWASNRYGLVQGETNIFVADWID
jgi:Tol biopolymer transport system component